MAGKLIALVLVALALRASGMEVYDESLLVSALDTRTAYVHAQFGVDAAVDYGRGAVEKEEAKEEAKEADPATLERALEAHYRVFPRAVGELLQRLRVRELHVALTQGQWRTDRWGLPIDGAPTGAEVRAWFVPGDDVDRRWTQLAHALSGLLCASFNFLDTTTTSSPQTAFAPAIQHSGVLRYGLLPRESVCTENVTPWLKLLPCHTHAGLAALLASKRLYDASYLHLALHAVPTAQHGMRLTLDLAAVLAIHPDPTLPAPATWTLSQVLGGPLRSLCPVANRTEVTVPLRPQYRVTGTVDNTASADPDVALYALRPTATLSTPFDVTFQLTEPEAETLRANDEAAPLAWLNGPRGFNEPKLVLRRHIAGTGQLEGTLVCELQHRASRDDNDNLPLTVTLVQQLPWFMRPYLHTLHVADVRTGRPVPILDTWYLPAELRGRPSLLELTLAVPPATTVTVVWDFQYVFLHTAEHRPDANRGFDVGAAFATFDLLAAGPLQGRQVRYGLDWPRHRASPPLGTPDARPQLETVRVYSANALAPLPTPDFSMPYNVITMTSTVVALAFGMLFNLLTREVRVVDATTAPWWRRLLTRKAKPVPAPNLAAAVAVGVAGTAPTSAS